MKREIKIGLGVIGTLIVTLVGVIGYRLMPGGGAETPPPPANANGGTTNPPSTAGEQDPPTVVVAKDAAKSDPFDFGSGGSSPSWLQTSGQQPAGTPHTADPAVASGGAGSYMPRPSATPETDGGSRYPTESSLNDRYSATTGAATGSRSPSTYPYPTSRYATNPPAAGTASDGSQEAAGSARRPAQPTAGGSLAASATDGTILVEDSIAPATTRYDPGAVAASSSMAAGNALRSASSTVKGGTQGADSGPNRVGFGTTSGASPTTAPTSNTATSATSGSRQASTASDGRYGTMPPTYSAPLQSRTQPGSLSGSGGPSTYPPSTAAGSTVGPTSIDGAASSSHQPEAGSWTDPRYGQPSGGPTSARNASSGTPTRSEYQLYANDPQPRASDRTPTSGLLATPSSDTHSTISSPGAVDARANSVAPSTGSSFVPASDPTQLGTDSRSGARTASAPATGSRYVVQPNDNFYTISEKAYGDSGYFKALYEYNRVQHPRSDQLQVGDQIEVPHLAVLEQRYPDLCPKPRSQPAASGNAIPVASNASTSASGRTYVVARGDTLFDIARWELGKAARWVEIYDLNRDQLGSDFNFLSPGMRLRLPKDAAGDQQTQRPSSNPARR